MSIFTSSSITTTSSLIPSLCLFLLILSNINTSINANQSLNNSNNNNIVTLNGIYRKVNQTEYVYQLPTQTPKGIFILLHGCNHAGTDFFPKSKSCEQCIGLPVEVHITKEVLSRNMIPLALTSANRDHKCWSQEDNFENLSNIIADFIKLYLPSNLAIPIYYFGASSGGSYAGMLSQYGRQYNLAVAGAIIEISSTRFIPSIPLSHIPTMVFIYMKKDRHSFTSIQKLSSILQSKNIPHISYAVNDQKITNDYFIFENILSNEDSSLFVSALIKEGYLSKEGYLIEDPRVSDWRQV